jgi:hypothetical protein
MYCAPTPEKRREDSVQPSIELADTYRSTTNLQTKMYQGFLRFLGVQLFLNDRRDYRPQELVCHLLQYFRIHLIDHPRH